MNARAEGAASGFAVPAGAEAVLADPVAGEPAVRFALTRTAESLRDALRVAECGERPAPA
ncbi:hypothetical protein EAO68_36485 [Streptomyces sp. wa22]|nr:hypothetical protein EAO68_36485 [Streptomyces sp. wa22]